VVSLCLFLMNVHASRAFYFFLQIREFERPFVFGFSDRRPKDGVISLLSSRFPDTGLSIFPPCPLSIEQDLPSLGYSNAQASFERRVFSPLPCSRRDSDPAYTSPNAIIDHAPWSCAEFFLLTRRIESRLR